MRHERYKKQYRVKEKVYRLRLDYSSDDLIIAKIEKDIVIEILRWSKRSIGYTMRSWYSPAKFDHNSVLPEDIAPRTPKGLAFLRKVILRELKNQLRKTKSKAKHIEKLIEHNS